jgi:hypothetical protein
LFQLLLPHGFSLLSLLLLETEPSVGDIANLVVSYLDLEDFVCCLEGEVLPLSFTDDLVVCSSCKSLRKIWKGNGRIDLELVFVEAGEGSNLSEGVVS